MSILKELCITCLCLSAAVLSFAQESAIKEYPSPLEMNVLNVIEIEETEQNTAADKTYQSPAPSFAWGADVGASIDLTGNDMSAFDINVLIGYKRGWINFLGIGLGADISVSNSTRAYPMFVSFRTNFRDRPSHVFWDLRGGMAYNQLEHNHEQWAVYASTGIGVNLASNSKFKSNLSLNYQFRQRKRVVGTEMIHEFTDLHMVSVRFGVIF